MFSDLRNPIRQRLRWTFMYALDGLSLYTDPKSHPLRITPWATKLLSRHNLVDKNIRQNAHDALTAFVIQLQKYLWTLVHCFHWLLVDFDTDWVKHLSGYDDCCRYCVSYIHSCLVNILMTMEVEMTAVFNSANSCYIKIDVTGPITPLCRARCFERTEKQRNIKQQMYS